MRSLERVNIQTNERRYSHTYIHTGQTLYPLHNFVVRGDKKKFWRDGGVARVSDFFFKIIQVFFFEGVKVREDWLV